VRRAAPILAALLALAFAGCGGDSNDEAATDLLERGLATDVETGVLTVDADVELKGAGQLDGPIRLELEGPFRAAGGPTEMPDLDMDFHAELAGLGFDGRVVLTPENAWIEFRGETYEVGEALWSRARAALRAEGGGPRTFRRAGADPIGWIEDAETEGDEDVNGTPTTKVAATLDLQRMLSDFNELIVQPGQRIPDGAIDEIDESAGDVELAAWIGEDDIWRRIATEAEFEVPEDRRDSAGGLESGHVTLDVTLDEPNEPVTITGPGPARPLSELLRALGIPPEALLGPGFEVPAPG
jgi:hypothetical protein